MNNLQSCKMRFPWLSFPWICPLTVSLFASAILTYTPWYLSIIKKSGNRNAFRLEFTENFFFFFLLERKGKIAQATSDLDFISQIVCGVWMILARYTPLRSSHHSKQVYTSREIHQYCNIVADKFSTPLDAQYNFYIYLNMSVPLSISFYDIIWIHFTVFHRSVQRLQFGEWLKLPIPNHSTCWNIASKTKSSSFS